MTIDFNHHEQPVQLPFGQSWSVHSPGETYHDTSAAELRQIVKEIAAGEPWRACIERHYAKPNPWLHRIVTDPSRDLFFREFPPRANALVLDVGAGWGQITLPLARNHHVVAIEPTPERLAFLRASAAQDGVDRQIAFIQSDFMDLDFATRFDLVCCIGVLEWVPKFRSGAPMELQREFLQRARHVLAPGGKLVVGIENRLGLKYLLGSRDDHTGLPNIAVLDRALAAQYYRAATGKELRSFTYSLAEYRTLFAAAGFESVVVYGAFPDYKLPQLILPADARLETHAALNPLPLEHDGADGYVLPTEVQDALASHYRSFAQMNVARFFAPSYFLVAEAATV